MRWIAGLIVLIAFQAQAAEIQSLRLVDTNDRVTAIIRTEGELQDELPVAEFINETIQMDLPQATVKGGEIQQKVNDPRIKSLYAYQLDSDTARIRILLNPGVKAEGLKSQVKIQIGAQGLEARLEKPAVRRQPVAVTAALRPRGASDGPAVAAAADDLAELSDSEIEKQLRTLPVSTKSEAPVASGSVAITPAQTVSKVAATEAVLNAESPSAVVKAESETPVFTDKAKKTLKNEPVSMAKTIFALAIVAMGLLTLYMTTKKWMDKRNQKNPHTSIRVVTQHYLGPKKSLAIISVAGESILIGITDQNISLIKSLALLDGEVPEETATDFHSSLTQAEAQDQSEDDYAVKGIREIVAGRLKGMRDLL